MTYILIRDKSYLVTSTNAERSNRIKYNHKVEISPLRCTSVVRSVSLIDC